MHFDFESGVKTCGKVPCSFVFVLLLHELALYAADII